MFPSAPVEACTQSGGARNWADMGGSRTSPDLSHAQWEVTVRQGGVRRGEVRQGKARSGEVRRGKARQDETRYGKVRLGKVRWGEVRSGEVSYMRGEVR